MNCKQCGAEISDDTVFCTKCGAKQLASGGLAETLNDSNSRGNDREAKEDAKMKELQTIKEILRLRNFEFTVEEKAEQERLKTAAKEAAEKARIAEKIFQETAEAKNIVRLEELIISKKEHRLLIDILTEMLEEEKEKAAEKHSDFYRLKKTAADTKKYADEYSAKLIKNKEEAICNKICHILGLDYSEDSVKFGSYEQGNGKKPIEWRVLKISEKGILLITKYAVDCKKYHETWNNMTWEKCNLRKWLNNDFLNSAFDKAEKNLIADTLCPADNNSKYRTNPGNATTDKVFLLSIPEVEKYFKSDEERKTATTAYAMKQGAYINGDYTTEADEPCCRWWLRSPGFYQHYAAIVRSDGSVDYRGDGVYYDGVYMRPALWINPES